MSAMSDNSEMDVETQKELENLRKMKLAMEHNCLLGPQYSKSQATTLSEAANVEEFSKIEFALALNKQCDEKLQRLEKVLEHRLFECRDKLKSVQGQNVDDVNRRESFRYINCGRPYFKDRENFAAPDNSDTVIMAKNHMYDFSSIASLPGWTMRDKVQLWTQLEKMSKNIKKRELQSTISALVRECKKKKFKEKKKLEKEIKKVKKELSRVNKRSLYSLALPLEEEYDWEEVASAFDSSLYTRHSATEYRGLWKLYLHPNINKNSWDKAEHQLLQKVAHENGLCEWEKIAKIMGNNRTGYQCFVYFRTNMNNTFTGKKWSPEEVAYLLRLIDYYKEDNYIPWVKVAALMENRTKIQIYNKYIRLLEQRKGRFLPEEDAVILTCADDSGPNYKKIAQYLPGRSIAQIRVRYQALNKKRVSTVWTVDEDRKLLQLLTNQDSSANYASITKYFPGKDRIHIRARYVTLVKWMRKNPNVEIAKAPRRGARRLGHGKATENLNVAVESLKTRILTEANRKKTNRINSNSTEEAIEDGIVAALFNESMNNDDLDLYIPSSTHESILKSESDINNENIKEGNLQRVLIMLRASLNKERFENRQINRCPTFNKIDDGTCVVKVKSYSKENKIKSIEINTVPDIWGSHTLEPIQYILPPNYATITGCRKFMTYFSKRERSELALNFSVMSRRNVILREQLDLLMERFNTLFLWPLLLSNESPNLDTILDSKTGNLSSQPLTNLDLGNTSDSDSDSSAD